MNSPITGKVISLDKVNDEAFSSEALGKGIAIIPSNGKVFAPDDGRITALFETKHAYGITTKRGSEVLIHIGIDTVTLEGKPFVSYVKQGQSVKKGDLIAEFDIDAIVEAGLDPITMIVITNTNQYLEIIPTKEDTVTHQSNLLTLL